MRKIRTVTASVRIDLAGGWTDAGPYVKEHGGCVLNVAIEPRVKASLGITMTVDPGDVPQYSGLGTSGAFRAAEIAVSNPEITDDEIVRAVYRLENGVLKHSVLICI